ncbi:MAG: tRNA preQ1(34) S-adenosylmethionine ribosyltransferase-isomerase QueA [Anaerolineaceae bacterium]|nr:tRNA preQ1(34) S-adenosylmethionine ribosyltransferase-isomerase QueA [Anaerolineaceae bacterium]
MKTDDFYYNLPQELIAQTPIEPRHHSRLLDLNRKTGEILHRHFYDIEQLLVPGDLLVLNQTKVIPARIHAHKMSGGRIEILLLRKMDSLTWECLIGGKRMGVGKEFVVENGPEGLVVEEILAAKKKIRFEQPIESFLGIAGEMPLPPYIHERLERQDRYQTVFAKTSGSAAAPTAGLHFTEELLNNLSDKGLNFAQVTLHVGLDTFAPVTEDDPEQHHIHKEWCELTEETADLIRKTRAAGKRVIAVGTTSVRTLETAARAASADRIVESFQGDTDLYILPGFTFKVVDAMITNFHLPRSTLLMLVSAFAGKQTIDQAYQAAIAEKYRFFSFGDAMFIHMD